MPVLVFVCTIWSRAPDGPSPQDLAGFATGLFWGVANTGSIHATKFLGMSLGFPLTQTCICINGAWGILFFKEMDGRLNIAMFSICTLAIIAGATLLTQSSQ